MTLLYPDIAGYQGQINLSGVPAVCAKATQGTSFKSAYYDWQKNEASQVGAFFFAYHFLEAGNGSAQADWCYSVVGKTPLMLDWEADGGSNPGVADAVAFIDRFRALGGIVNLVYLPHWYWVQLNMPDLTPITSRGLMNVTSYYTTYSDSGPGWSSFGGLPVAVWQYSDSTPLDGQAVDYNAFKGTVVQLAALVGGTMRPEDQILKLGSSGDAVRYLQTRLNVWGASLTVDGSFGPLTDAAVRAFQGSHNLTVDAIVGPHTWAALDASPTPPPPPTKVWKEWVTTGMYSLADFATIIAETDVVTLITQTVRHYSGLDPVLMTYLSGLAYGTTKPTDKLTGATFWVYTDK